MKQIEVSILGQTYMLGCPEGAETMLRGAVAAVDHEMTLIRDAGKVKARERVAVLAALNLAFQLAESAEATKLGAQRGTASAASPMQVDNESSNNEPHALAELVRRIDAALEEDGQLL